MEGVGRLSGGCGEVVWRVGGQCPEGVGRLSGVCGFCLVGLQSCHSGWGRCANVIWSV